MIRLFIIALALVLLTGVHAQSLSATEVQQLVTNKRFTFKAERVNPQNGASRQLNTEYFLKIANDTLTSALPYFGRAYTAPINPSDAGYDFVTTTFDYVAATKKKGRYLVSVKTKDRLNNVDFELTIFYNGNANLEVSSNDKQPISFNGYLRK